MFDRTKLIVAALTLVSLAGSGGCIEGDLGLDGGADAAPDPTFRDGSPDDRDTGQPTQPSGGGTRVDSAVAMPDAVAPAPYDGATGVDATQTEDAEVVDTGSCCPDGNCLCHGPNPVALTSEKGPYGTESYAVTGGGCVYYPKDAQPPFAAVAIADGQLGAGGCGSFQTNLWGPFYASWGIVTMIVDTGAFDNPAPRGDALARGITAFKAENLKSGSPLEGKLAGRYATSGFSMGGGGTSYAAQKDPSMLSDVAMMPWGVVTSGIKVPTLVICGASDGTAPCNAHGIPMYNGIADSVPKMRVQVQSGHDGQPGAGSGHSGEVALAFQKVFLEGDLRWRPLLVGTQSVATNIK